MWVLHLSVHVESHTVAPECQMWPRGVNGKSQAGLYHFTKHGQ